MIGPSIKHVVIAGGGTAGWMTACALISQLGHFLKVTLVESDEIATVGVGEATIPTMQTFHLLLQLDEQEFVRETNATFKLGIQFENWGAIGDKYIHSFGETGREFWAGQFQHYWMRARQQGSHYSYSDYSAEALASMAGKFAITKNPRLGYAYHLDAGRYAKYLRKISEQRGVVRVEGKISQVALDADSGNIKALHLNSGQVIEGDLFIDCTGFRGLLIEQALHVGYESWTNHFLCDRAVAVQTSLVGEPLPYTRAIAHPHGWQWRIPLQHRQGNGFVFSNKYLDDDTATRFLLERVEGERLTEPRVISFTPGRRKKTWHKNCVAIGLSSGFIEPLESTSIHLISSSVIRLMRLLPLGADSEYEAEEFNRQSAEELKGVKDFVLLHYKATERNDSEFWNYCRNMPVPASLQTRMSLYSSSARLFWSADELFTTNSWNQVLLGQGVIPQAYHPAADILPAAEFERFMRAYRESVQAFVEKMPSHQAFINSFISN